MTYLELAKKVLEEAQQLMRVDDIWAFAKEKGYHKTIDSIFSDDKNNVNALDIALAQNLDKERYLGLVEKRNLYYLTTFDNLNHLVENALDTSPIKSYQEVLESQKGKGFTPIRRGFEGMVLFFVIPVGLPISLWVTATTLGSYSPNVFLLLGTLMLTFFSAFPVLFYIQLTNCNVHIYPEKIEFVRIFPPKNLIGSIEFRDILAIKAKGLGREEQISSDFKFIQVKFKKGNQEETLRFRCHAYINPSPIFDPYRTRVRNYQSFLSLRLFLKEISSYHNINYTEF